MNTGSASADQLIDNLKQKWDQLSDLDRALAVRKIKLCGSSIRGIARVVGRSDGSLRHLLKILDAPAADLAAARHGSISTNELARRGKVEVQRRKKKDSQARRIENKRKAIKISKTIRAWLEQENLSGSRGVAIALEARSKLISGHNAGKLPPADPQVVRPAPHWIEKCRPQTPVSEDSNYINWYAIWLAQWSYCLCRQADLAIDALGIAGKL